MMRDLPWSIIKEQIHAFLFGSKVLDVIILKDSNGRPNGEAIVKLETEEDAENALKYWRQTIGKRNITVEIL